MMFQFKKIKVFTIFLIVLSVNNFFSLVLAEGGDEVGNGGGTWVCRNEGGAIRWAELVDIWEARNEYQLDIRISEKQNQDEYIQESLEKLSRLSENLRQQLEKELQKVSQNIRVLEQTKGKANSIDIPRIKRIHDATIRVFPDAKETCSEGILQYEQLANYTPYGDILLDPEIFEAIPLVSQWMFFVHEAAAEMYRKAPDFAKTTDKARRLTGLLASTKELWDYREEITPGRMGEEVPNGACILSEIEPKFRSVGKGRDGYIPVSFPGTGGDDGYSHVMDQYGRLQAMPEGVRGVLGHFSEGVFPASSESGLYGFVNHKLEWVISPQWSYVEEMAGGYARVFRDGKSGIIDTRGNYVVPLEMESIHQSLFSIFHDGLVAVAVGTHPKGYDPEFPNYAPPKDFGFVSVDFAKNREWKVSPLYNSVQNFYKGLAIVEDKRGLYGVIDKNSNYVIKPNYEYIAIASGDPYIFQVQMGDRFALVDVNGHWYSSFEYEYVKWLGAYRFAIRDEGLWSIIDLKDKSFYKKMREDLRSFYGNASRNELIMASYKNGYIGYINKNGEEVIPPIFKGGLTTFNYGVASVKNFRGQYGVINRAGRVIVPFEYDYIGSASFSSSLEDWVETRKNGKSGVIKIKKDCLF